MSTVATARAYGAGCSAARCYSNPSEDVSVPGGQITSTILAAGLSVVVSVAGTTLLLASTLLCGVERFPWFLQPALPTASRGPVGQGRITCLVHNESLSDWMLQPAGPRLVAMQLRTPSDRPLSQEKCCPAHKPVGRT